MAARLGGRASLSGERLGSAALEFALIAPLMTLLILGTIEFINISRLQAKLNVAAGQLVEMIAAQPAVVDGTASAQPDKTASLSDMCGGAAINMLPFEITAFAANIASITNANTPNGTAPIQDWESDSACGTAATHAGYAAMLTLANTPRSLFTKDGSSWDGTAGSTNLGTGYAAVIVQVRYQYTNFVPFFLNQYINLSATAVARPRSNATVNCTLTPIGSASSVACPQNN